MHRDKPMQLFSHGEHALPGAGIAGSCTQTTEKQNKTKQNKTENKKTRNMAAMSFFLTTGLKCARLNVTVILSLPREAPVCIL